MQSPRILTVILRPTVISWFRSPFTQRQFRDWTILHFSPTIPIRLLLLHRGWSYSLTGRWVVSRFWSLVPFAISWTSRRNQQISDRVPMGWSDTCLLGICVSDMWNATMWSMWRSDRLEQCDVVLWCAFVVCVFSLDFTSLLCLIILVLLLNKVFGFRKKIYEDHLDYKHPQKACFSESWVP